MPKPKHMRMIAIMLAVWLSGTVGAEVNVKKQTWEGPVFKGEETTVLENEHLAVYIVKTGARIISIVDKRSGEDFINCGGIGRASNDNGIYDRVNHKGKHAYRLTEEGHFASRPYNMEKTGAGQVTCSATSDHIKLTRILTLDAKQPKLRIQLSYESVAEEQHIMGLAPVTQFNLNNAAVTYNQVVVFPKEDGVEVNSTRDQGFAGKSPAAGWLAVADRHSKKAIAMSFATDGSVKKPYLYRIPQWIHLLPFGPEKLVQKGAVEKSWYEYHFLVGEAAASALKEGDVTLPAVEFKRMQQALTRELATAPVLPGQKQTPKLPQANCTPADFATVGKPVARVAFLRNAVFSHPEKLTAQSFTSLSRLENFLAEAKLTGADLLWIVGASANGLAEEMKLSQQAVSLTGLKTVFTPNVKDTEAEGFAELGTKRGTQRIGDVTFIHFSPGDEKWLEETINKTTEGRIVVVGNRVPSGAAVRTKVTLAVCTQRITMPAFKREGNWPILHLPQVQDRGAAFAVLNIHPDHFDIQIKSIGKGYGTRLYLDREGKSPAFGIPPHVSGKPLLRIAHLADTQLASTLKQPDALDQQNTKTAYAEVNKLGVDYAVMAGDLVNIGTDVDQWAAYDHLKKALNVTLYEVLGNHDWDEATPDGRYIIDTYTRKCDDPLDYDVEKNGILLTAFATALTPPAEVAARKAKAQKAKCTVLLYHDPISKGGGYNWWSPELHEAAHSLRPTIALAGHTHSLEWRKDGDIHEFIAPGLGWTKMGDKQWNGYFIHTFFEDKVVSSFKRLLCDDIFFTTVTPYRNQNGAE